MLHLSSSAVAIQLRLDSATPKTSHLAALVTKYYSPGGKEEVQGWRRSLDTEVGNLSVQTSRPYTVRNRGQWTSQPHYPHTKTVKTASNPKLKQSQEKLVKVALKPSVGELAWELETGTEAAKLYLPPLRHLDNSASHHDHPALTERPLIVVAEKDVFPAKAPKPAKSKARGRTKTTTHPIDARLVQFPKSTRYSFSLPTEEPPMQEKCVLALACKPVAAPEKRVRQFRPKQPDSDHLFEKSESREEEIGAEAIEDQSEQSEGSLFSYTDEAEESDQSVLEPTPFPDLQPTPTQEDCLFTPEPETRIPPFSDVKITPITENLPTLEGRSTYCRDPLPALFDPANEETDRGTKWTSVSTMENSLGQALYVDDRSIEGTHERVNTEVSLESFEAASSEFASNIQIVDSIIIVSEAAQEELFLEVPASKVVQREGVRKRGSVQVPKPDTSPRLKKAVSLELPPLSYQPRHEAPAAPVLSSAQLADLETRTQKGTKKPPPFLELETRTVPQTRKTRKEASFRKPSMGSPIAKKSKTASKPTTKVEEFDFNRDVSKPSDLQTAILTHSNSAVDGEDYLVIHEQAGEESEEEGCDTSKPSGEVPIEEVKKAVGLNLYQLAQRRSSVNLEGMLRRGSTQADPSLEEEPLNKSASIVDASTQKVESNKPSRKGKSRTNKTTQPPRKFTQKKTTVAAQLPETTKISVTSPEEPTIKLIRTVSGEVSAHAAGLKRSAQSSLSSSFESSDSEEIEARKSGTEASKAKTRKQTARPKPKAKEARVGRKRTSIFSSDRSDYGSESDFSSLSRQPADEVFVRHFAVNMLGFMHRIAPKHSPAVTRGLAQLSKVRKEVLSIGYGVLGGDAQRRASILARRRTSNVDIKRPQRLRRSITSVALAGLKENLDHELNPSDDDAASDESQSSSELRHVKFSRADFEIKHLSMLKSLAMKLLNIGQFAEVEEVPAVPQLSAGELWELEYKDHRQTVSHTLDGLFKDYKTSPITAFTSVATNFFRNPQSLRNAAEENEELEKVEIDTENYRDELERRKFQEYSRQWTTYKVMRLAPPESMHQVTNERFNPVELSMYFRSMILKRKLRRSVLEVRNGTQPVVLKAKPRTTDTGLLLEYYQQQVRAAEKAKLPRDVILSGGAHQVESQAEYQERVYCRIKHEKNLQKFSHPPKHGT